MFADDDGNIAYYTDHELPLREDLQAGTVDGLPPYFIRDGTGTLRHEWIPAGARPESHAIPFAILPDAELDQLVNPERGWIWNANQDPTGQTYDNDALNETPARRRDPLRLAGACRRQPEHACDARVEEALADGSITFAEMQSAQADVQLNDAEVLVPGIVAALQLAQTPGPRRRSPRSAPTPRVREAVARLAAWGSRRRPASPRATTRATWTASARRRRRPRSTPASPPRSTASGAARRWPRSSTDR